MDMKTQLLSERQAREELELQVREKEELILKREQEIKKLQEQLEKVSSNRHENVNIGNNVDGTKLLELQLAKQSEKEREYEKSMEHFENSISANVSELKKWKEENETAKRHLGTLEVAFSDVLQKYERCKTIIEGYKANEETLKQNLHMYEDTLHKTEEKYEVLKAHAKAQLDKCNKEIMLARDRYEAEINKLNTINKRLEIKIDSLNNALEQKKKECTSLAALFDEMTGNV